MADSTREPRERPRTVETAARIRLHRATHAEASQAQTAAALGISRSWLRRVSDADGIRWPAQRRERAAVLAAEREAAGTAPAGEEREQEGDGQGEGDGDRGDGERTEREGAPIGQGGTAPTGQGKPADPTLARGKPAGAGGTEGERAAPKTSPPPEAIHRVSPPPPDRPKASAKKGEEEPAEGGREAARKVHDLHSAKVAAYAAETYDWVLAAGREIWDLWDRSGYRAEFPDPEAFTRYMVAFFGHWYPRLARMVRDMEDAEEDLDRWGALTEPAARRVKARAELISAMMLTNMTGTPLTAEGIRELYSILKTPIFDEEGENVGTSEHTRE